MKNEYEVLKRKLEKLNKSSERIEKVYDEADYLARHSAYLNPFFFISSPIGYIIMGPTVISRKINEKRRLKLERKYNELTVSIDSTKKCK